MEKAIIFLMIIFLGDVAAGSNYDSKTRDCVYKVAFRADPYACAGERSYAHCMECIDHRIDACELKMKSECGINEVEAKDECAQGKYLSARICAKEL